MPFSRKYRLALGSCLGLACIGSSVLSHAADQVATPMPFSVTVDMTHILELGGFSYLPRQDKLTDGIVESYRFETSLDGKAWTKVVDQGRFDNIRNNPVLQEVPFAPTNARYFRFSALKDINGQGKVSISELSVLPVESSNAALP